MDKLRAMNTFVMIVDKGSFSSAAEQLNRSPAAVVRALAELEKYLGVRLLNRSTRRIALTEEGREYVQHCRQILTDVRAAEFALDSRKINPVGKLCITAPVTFGRLHMAPLLNRWLKQFPSMQVELTLLNRVTDLIEEGFDLALRIGNLEDSSLIAKHLGTTQTVTCASPALIQRLGLPEKPSDLEGWPAIVFSQHGECWKFNSGKKTFSQKMNPIFTTNDIDTVLTLSVNGLGVASVMHYQAKCALESGDLVPLLVDYALPPIPVQFIYPHNRLIPTRVRRFLDWSSPKLKNCLLDSGSNLIT